MTISDQTKLTIASMIDRHWQRNRYPGTVEAVKRIQATREGVRCLVVTLSGDNEVQYACIIDKYSIKYDPRPVPQP